MNDGRNYYGKITLGKAGFFVKIAICDDDSAYVKKIESVVRTTLPSLFSQLFRGTMI